VICAFGSFQVNSTLLERRRAWRMEDKRNAE
jgi:hypothetical protein